MLCLCCSSNSSIDCNVKDKVKGNVKAMIMMMMQGWKGLCGWLKTHNDNVNFTVNDDVKDNDKDNDNVNVNDNDNVDINDYDNVNVNVNDNDIDRNKNVSFPESIRCVISGPSECGKTWLLWNIIINRIYFDKLYIIGLIDDQYEDPESINEKADAEFIKDITDLSSTNQLPEEFKELIMFDYDKAKESFINENFCTDRHNNCNIIYLSQNLFSLDGQNVREDCNLIILFEQQGKALASIYQDFFSDIERTYNDLLVYVMKYGESLITTLSLIYLSKNINGKEKLIGLWLYYRLIYV